MLQRLQDSDDFFVNNWCVRVFESKESRSFNLTLKTHTVIDHYIVNLHMAIITLLLHLLNMQKHLLRIDIEQWGNTLVVVQDRLRWLYTQKGVTYISIFINHGKNAGAVT